jgi:nucleotide-binding universal stress UspA family protein
MKIIVGVDLQQAYKPALHLIGKLELKDPELLFVQASPTVDSMLPPFPIDGATVNLLHSAFRDAGEAALLEAETEAKNMGLTSLPLLCVGPSAELLNECVERESADLVALRTTHRGAWQSEFMGSVTRTVMLCGHISVLIAKHEPTSGNKLDAVFATDGSEFNDRCLERFLTMRPAGIETIHVVSAWGLASPFEHLLRHALPHSPDMNTELQSAAKSAAERTAARLTEVGYKTVAEVHQGAPDKVLHDAMIQSGAGLLILGAHGKNWIERLLIGSTSLHQVIDESYNVLVLRP